MKARSKRPPQLALRLDAAAPDHDARWGAGSSIVYLGTPLTLVLDTTRRLPERDGKELHLPLPPAATARQIRDAAESWLRDEALRIFSEKSALAGQQTLRIALSFGKRGDWAQRDGDVLRCHWRLVEQAPAVIEQVMRQAATQAAARPACDDLFSCAG